MNYKAAKQLLFLSESTGFGPTRASGGGELFAIEFLCELANRGWEISVVCPEQSPLLRSLSLRGRVSFHPLDLSAKMKQLSFLRIVSAWLLLSRRFRNHVMHGNGYATVKWLFLAKVLWHTRVFCHLQESSYEFYDSRRARILTPFVDRFFAISDSVRDLFIKGTHIARNKVVRVHHGVPIFEAQERSNQEEVEVRGELALPLHGPLVMMASRTDPLKGHETFLRAVKAVRASVPDAIFLIVGLEANTAAETELYNHLQRIIESERIRTAVHCTGYRQDVRRLMRCADVVVVPSTQEGFGRTATEAMAEKTPVIASSTGGLKEIITDGVDGWLFPPGDHNALAERLVTALCNPGAARTIARGGYLTARSKFSTATMTSAIEHHLLDLRRA
jgi:glycosyltransferase involved in cell wall biosynthesis